VITGDVGAGKTVAVRAAVSALDPTRHQVIYIANPAFGTRGLYVTIVRALGAEPRYLKAELMAQAQDLPDSFIPDAASPTSRRHPHGDQLSRAVTVGRGGTHHAHRLAITSQDQVQCHTLEAGTPPLFSIPSAAPFRQSRAECAWSIGQRGQPELTP
jgi:hypothetical protein